ncbi:hypothetical protein [Niveispirillum sp. KHB5.9]|uniref:hypothetical protein n=1 Tax=Niveispirillum sp. KHB5.9 TaxID=3400269 RepID=UPI003A8AC6E4
MPRPRHLEGLFPAASATGGLLGLALVLASQAGGGNGAPPPPLPALSLPAAAPAGGTGAAPGAVLARPPFTPGRRPPARQTVQPTTDNAQADLRLTGIIATPGGGVAMAIDQRTQQPVTLRAGSPFQDWTVETVARDSVTLRRGGETRLLTLPLAKQAATGPVP